MSLFIVHALIKGIHGQKTADQGQDHSRQQPISRKGTVILGILSIQTKFVKSFSAYIHCFLSL